MALRPLLLMLFLCSPALAKVETWTNQTGGVMQAELIDADESNAIFLKASDQRRYRVPISTLSDGDQERVHAAMPRLTAEHEERRRKRSSEAASPAAPPAAKAKTEADKGKSIPAAAKPASQGPRLPSVTHNLSELLVTVKNNTFEPASVEIVKPIKYYGIYFAAGWSGASRKFTPELVAAYPALKTAHPDFEIVFVSTDDSETDMLAFMTEERMPWPAIKYENLKLATSVRRYRGKGVPNLVFVSANGKLLASSYVKKPSPEATKGTEASLPAHTSFAPPPSSPMSNTATTLKEATNKESSTLLGPVSVAPKEIEVYEGPHKVLAYIREYLDNPPPPSKSPRRTAPSKPNIPSPDKPKAE